MSILHNHPKVLKLEENLTQQLKTQLSEEEAFKIVEFDEKEVERSGYSNYSYWRSTFRAFARKPVAMFFIILMVIILVFTFIQPYLPDQVDSYQVNNDPATGMPLKNVQPGERLEIKANNEISEHTFLMGTNSIGQDLWSRIWSGTRTSLEIGVLVAVIESIVGILVGVLWGYVRKLDFFFTELYNIMDNIPTTIVLILVAYIPMPGVSPVLKIVISLTIQSWIGMARFVRNQIIIIRDREYNLASRCLGTNTFRIITKNLLPYLVSVIMLRMALSIPGAIGSEVFITYIGLGLPAETASLGNLIIEGRKQMMSPSLLYQLLYPTIILSMITISFYVVGNAFSDAADPKNHVN